MFRKTTVSSFLTGLGVALLMTACAADTVSGPQAANTAAPAAPVASGSLLTTLGSLVGTVPSKASSLVSGLLQRTVSRAYPLRRNITVSTVIGPRGGVLFIRQTGLTVTFSPGALLTETRITATANAGSAISYDFGPHGTQFHAPVQIVQGLANTTIRGDVGQANNLFGGYMPDGVSDIKGDSVSVSELHKAQTIVGRNVLGQPVLINSTFIVSHFSGYILISGRR
jgi:hypothetical protein